MSTEDDARSRLCPACRSDSIQSQACVACAQARRIDELETAVERLVVRVGKLESCAKDDEAEEGTRIATESK